MSTAVAVEFRIPRVEVSEETITAHLVADDHRVLCAVAQSPNSGLHRATD
jgi:hypothetical protein